MNSQIKISKKVFLRNAEQDEIWLQDKIYENPSILGLGTLVPVSKEKKQSTGGKLDILLKDPEDNSMYEVEIMLGETDPSHIIRSIEYWDLEKKRYPQRQHFCVLCAESFERRYFNVLQLLSLNIPMIAIQIDLLEVEGQKILNFTKIFDIYEEPEEEESSPANEAFWQKNSLWTLNAAKKVLNVLTEVDGNLTFRFTQSYITIAKQGKNLYYFAMRAKPRSLFWFKEKDDERIEKIKALIDKDNIFYTYNKYNEFVMSIDENSLQYKNALQEIHKIRFPKESVNQENTHGH